MRVHKCKLRVNSESGGLDTHRDINDIGDTGPPWPGESERELMMQPFDTQSQGIGASAWLRRNASGNCSILMGTSAGVAVYTYWHDNPAGPMIYGPIGYRDEAGKTRIMYRSLPQVSERRTIL